MTTSREHILADMAYIYAQDGAEVVEVLLDSQTYRVIVQELEILPGAFDGEAVRRQNLWFEKGAITLPRPGYIIDRAGEKWTVESVDPTGLVDIITMALYQ